MIASTDSNSCMRRRRKPSVVMAIVLASLASTACSPKGGQDAAKPATMDAPAAVAQEDEGKCTSEPRKDEHDARPRCGGMAMAAPLQAYRIVVGGGDPVDQVVCDIGKTFVLEGKMFGTEFSGGMDGTYKMVRTPNIPGLQWKASGTYRVELPDGPGKPGTMSVKANEATTRAGGQVDENAGYTDTFTLTPVAACEQ